MSGGWGGRGVGGVYMGEKNKKTKKKKTTTPAIT